MPSLEAYRRELDYSYAPGIFPAMECLKKRPELARRLLISEKGKDSEGVQTLIRLAEERQIRVETADKALSRISGKENCFAAAVFEKRPAALRAGCDHVVLHHIADQGNLGTILRTALGFGWHDLAVIRPAADVYDPKVVRASMGAVFSLRVREYPDFQKYRAEFPDAQAYPFMLDGSVGLDAAAQSAQRPCALIFGNEGAGLPAEFLGVGQPVRIPSSDEVDSLNLAVAAAIGMYAFRRGS
ncbi:MAG: TrmH family RNA methyltransferase [Clostridiales bacterium]|nr:TrmH family RNA methyltransferase [Clostridiales bacterium]